MLGQIVFCSSLDKAFGLYSRSTIVYDWKMPRHYLFLIISSCINLAVVVAEDDHILDLNLDQGRAPLRHRDQEVLDVGVGDQVLAAGRF